MDTTVKLMSRSGARAWRDVQHGPIVFTNGVFDVLHAGHVSLLETARALGNVLIVGVNTDDSVRRLGKGSDRPLNDAAARARVLGALAAVDAIVLFDEDTPEALVTELSPDVLVKGADYPRERIAGADLVEARGGRVVRVPLVPGLSTTQLLERVRASS